MFYYWSKERYINKDKQISIVNLILLQRLSDLDFPKKINQKIIFCKQYRLSQYMTLSFSLYNKPAQFKYYTIDIWSKYLNIFCLAYLNNIFDNNSSLYKYWKYTKFFFRK